jgi:hypothetical protein
MNELRGIFNLVELMRLDMANFTLSQNRQLIGSYSAKIEFDEFQNLLQIDKCNIFKHFNLILILKFQPQPMALDFGSEELCTHFWMDKKKNQRNLLIQISIK